MQTPSFEIVYGVVGYKAVGKGVFADRAAAEGFGVYTLSTPLKAIYRDRNGGREDWTVKDLVAIGDEMRKKHGPGYLAGEALKLAGQDGKRRAVIDGLRNPGEVERLRELAGDRLVLVGISAPTVVRYRFCAGRAKPGDPKDLESFLVMDDRDRGIGQPADGQQVDRTMAMVPPEQVFMNVGTLKEFQEWIDERIKSDCIRLVLHRPPAARTTRDDGTAD